MVSIEQPQIIHICFNPIMCILGLVDGFQSDDVKQIIKNMLYANKATADKPGDENINIMNKQLKPPRKTKSATEISSESEGEAAEPWNDGKPSSSEAPTSDESLSEPENVESDHELDPESDFDDSVQAEPDESLSTSTAVEGDGVKCQVCMKTKDPQWILLCDDCGTGYHCSCLKPALLAIPSNTWLCPDCSHQMLIGALENKLEELDKMAARIKKSEMRKEILELRRQRYAMMTAVAGEAAEKKVSSRLRQRRAARNYRHESFDEMFQGIEGLDESTVEDAEESSQEGKVVHSSLKVVGRTGKRRLLNIFASSEEEEDVQPEPAPAPAEGRSLRSRAKN